MTGNKRVDHWTCGFVYECSEIAGSPQGSPSSRLCRLWSQKEDLQQAWNRDRRAVWDQVGLSHCWHNGLVIVWDKSRLRRGHNDQSCQGHQCSKTTQHWWPRHDWSLWPHLRWSSSWTVTSPACRQCDNPTWSHTVSLVQWVTYLLPIMRDPGSILRGVFIWNRDSPVRVVSLQHYISHLRKQN
jgi:hypothetical protein